MSIIEEQHPEYSFLKVIKPVGGGFLDYLTLDSCMNNAHVVSIQNGQDRGGSNGSPIRKRSRINSESKSASDLKSVGQPGDSVESSRLNSPEEQQDISNGKNSINSPARGQSRSPKKTTRDDSRENSANKINTPKQRSSTVAPSPKRESRTNTNGNSNSFLVNNSQERDTFHDLALRFLSKTDKGKEKTLNFKNTIYSVAALFCRWSHLYGLPQRKGQFAKYLAETSNLRRQTFPSMDSHKLYRFKQLS